MSRLTRPISICAQAPSRAAGAPDVDVTPIMNMFVILIPFLVSMAVFTHLAVLRFSLPGDGAAGGEKSPRLPLTVAMTLEELAVTHGERILSRHARTEDGHAFAQLGDALQALRGSAGTIADTIVIAVDDGLLFDEIVQCMDACREAGFVHVRLAQGTSLDAAAENLSERIGG